MGFKDEMPGAQTYNKNPFMQDLDKHEGSHVVLINRIDHFKTRKKLEAFKVEFKIVISGNPKTSPKSDFTWMQREDIECASGCVKGFIMAALECSAADADAMFEEYKVIGENGKVLDSFDRCTLADDSQPLSSFQNGHPVLMVHTVREDFTDAGTRIAGAGWRPLPAHELASAEKVARELGLIAPAPAQKAAASGK